MTDTARKLVGYVISDRLGTLHDLVPAHRLNDFNHLNRDRWSIEPAFVDVAEGGEGGDDLRPCPFCKGGAQYDSSSDCSARPWVMCCVCGAHVCGETEAAARAAWNARAA